MVVQYQNKLVGFVSGYRLPDNPKALFIWQVGVDDSMRGRGLAKKMIKTLLDSVGNIETIHTTVSPSNVPSNKLFDSIAKEYGTTIEHQTFLSEDDFEAGHEEEILKIIPIKN